METSTSSSSDVRLWNVLCHATALLGFFVPWAGHILGPLIIWLAKRGDSAEIDAQNLVLVIVASIQASEGKFYRYPLAIRLIK